MTRRPCKLRAHKVTPERRGRNRWTIKGQTGRETKKKDEAVIACGVSFAMHLCACREIALRRSLDLRGLFSRLPARAAWPTLPTSPHGACEQLCCKSCNRSTTRPQQRSSSMGKCESRNACSSGTTPPEVWHHKHHSALLRATEAMQHKKYTHH